MNNGAGRMFDCEIPIDVLHFRQMSTTLSIRLPEELAAWVKKTAKRTSQPQGEVVRQELEKARKAAVEKPWMNLAGAVRGPRDLSTREGFDKR